MKTADLQPEAALESNKGFYRRFCESPRAGWRTFSSFCKELWNDHDFWVHTMAVKGGASAVIIAGVVGISHVVAMPFILASVGIVLCSGLIALGLYGVVAGSNKAVEHFKKIYNKALGRTPAAVQKPRKPKLSDRLKEKPAVRKILAHPYTQKLLASRAWKTAEKMSQKSDHVLRGLAVGGSAVSVTLGVMAITTQLLVLPVIAVGSLVTFAVVAGLTQLASGAAGLYLSIQSIVHKRRNKKAGSDEGDEPTDTEARAPAIDPMRTPQPLPEPVASSFNKAVRTGAQNDNETPEMRAAAGHKAKP